MLAAAHSTAVTLGSIFKSLPSFSIKALSRVVDSTTALISISSIYSVGISRNVSGRAASERMISALTSRSCCREEVIAKR